MNVVISRKARAPRFNSRQILITTAAATACACLLPSIAQAQSSLPGGIYLEQIGNGSTPADTTTQQSLFIDSFAPGDNSPQLTINLPTADSGSVHAATDIANEGGGTGFSHGMMQATPDGRMLILGAYDKDPNAATNQKTIALIDSLNGNVNTGSYTAATSAGPRSVESTDDGAHVYYDGSATGLRYITAPNHFSTPNSAVQRTVSVFDGQLFESGAASNGGATGGNPGISVVGSGAEGSTSVNQTYVITTGTDPEQFVMLDQNPSVGFNNNVGGNNYQTNLDLCYVATDNGMEKYVYNGSSWSLTETINAGLGTSNKITTELVGLTYAGKDASGNNVLYATTAGDFSSGTSEGNALMKLVDTGAGATWELVSLSADNTWFRGLATIKQSGDANGDFKVDSADFDIVAANFGQTGVTGGFADGDFNYDGTVNALDFNALATNFGFDESAGLDAADLPSAQPLGTAVPEPAALSILFIGGLAIRRRR